MGFMSEPRSPRKIERGFHVAEDARELAPRGIAFIEQKVAALGTLQALAFAIVPGKDVFARVATPSRKATTIRATVCAAHAPRTVVFARPSACYSAAAQTWTCKDPLVNLDASLAETLSAGAALARAGDPKTAYLAAVQFVRERAPELSITTYVRKGPAEWFTRSLDVNACDADEALVTHVGWCFFWYLQRRKLIRARRSPVQAATLAIEWLNEFRANGGVAVGSTKTQ